MPPRFGSILLAAPLVSDEVRQVGDSNTNRVHDTEVSQLPQRAELVDRRRANAEPLPHLPHREQPLDPAVQLVERGWDWL